MLKTQNKINPIITKAKTIKRLNAFFVTGLCVFVLSCLFWPLSASDFRSIAAITVAASKNDQSKTQLEQALAQIIREETSDERLEAMVSQIEVAGKIHTRQIESRDHNSMRKALQISVSERDYGYDFRLGFDGLGGADEQELVKMLAQRIASRLAPETGGRRPSKSTLNKSIESLAQLQTQQARSFDLAKWIVDQIEDDLKSVKISLARMGDGGAGLANDPDAANANGSQFQFASSRKVIGDTGELQATIESIDLNSLREVLAEMQQRLDVQKNLINAQPPVSSNTLSAGQFLVGQPNRILTRPLDASPGSLGFFLVGLTSVIVGSIVALNFQPFECRGFENARSVGRVLGIPVVAQILAETTSENSEPKKRHVPWANRVSAIASLLLFGIFVVVAGFVLINPEVREAFYENPLFGCVQIIRMFAGY